MTTLRSGARFQKALALGALITAPLAGQSVVRGAVRDTGSAHPLGGVGVELAGTRLRAITGADGRYEIRDVAGGSYTLRARAVGFLPSTREIVVPDSSTVEADFALQAVAVPLADIVVTPSRLGVAQERTASTATLSREDMDVMPQLGEDIYHAISRLPGLAANEYSAKFWVRGGPNEELLARLDGLDLIEPFHLKDLDAALSIIDAETLGRLDLTSGGFTAEYGDRLTGVLEMTTETPPQGRVRTSIGLSLTNARIASRGSYDAGRGTWLVSARRGYLDLVLGIIDPDSDLSPKYYDVMAKTEYKLGERHTVSAHFLRAGDALEFTDDGARLASRYGTTFGWFGWRGGLGSAVSGNATVSVGRLSWNRSGDGVLDGQDTFGLRDVRHATIAGLRQDWTLGITPGILVKAGLDVKRATTDYDYARGRQVTFVRNDSIVQRTDTVHGAFVPRGTAVGGHLALRVRPVEPLTIEAGGRYDRHSHIAETTLSPRLNAALALGRRTTLRASWGVYFQAPGVHELRVQDGETAFRPSQRAEQLVGGVEHFFPGGTGVRLEAYRRRYTRLHPLYLNLDNVIDAFPELEDDRVRLERSGGRAVGAELLVERRLGRRFDWAASYAYAIVDDQVAGRAVPRSRDQRHTVNLDVTYAPSRRWRISGAWQYHSGWPYTSSSFSFTPRPGGGAFFFRTFDPINGARLPAYHRLDARITRQIPIRRSMLRVYVDVFNLYNRGNPRGYEYSLDIRNGQLFVTASPDNQLPRLPTIGASLEF